MENNSPSKKDLEKELLQAQIIQLDKKNKHSLIREMFPALSAIIFSIAASVVVILIGNNVIDSVLVELNDIKKKIAIEKKLLSSLNIEVKERNKKNVELIGNASFFDQGIDLNISFKDSGVLGTMIVATSTTDNISLEAFDQCVGEFAFPGAVPDFNSASCRPLQDDSSICNTVKTKTKCNFGPISPFTDRELGLWVTATKGTRKAIKYVNILAR